MSRSGLRWHGRASPAQGGAAIPTPTADSQPRVSSPETSGRSHGMPAVIHPSRLANPRRARTSTRHGGHGPSGTTSHDYNTAVSDSDFLHDESVRCSHGWNPRFTLRRHRRRSKRAQCTEDYANRQGNRHSEFHHIHPFAAFTSAGLILRPVLAQVGLRQHAIEDSLDPLPCASLVGVVNSNFTQKPISRHPQYLR